MSNKNVEYISKHTPEYMSNVIRINKNQKSYASECMPLDMPVVVPRYNVAKLVIFRLCAYQCMSQTFSGGRMTV